MRHPRDRLEYSAIVDRRPLRLPGGARLVVWPIVNVEVWDIARPMARQVMPAPSGVPVVPDFPNWSWHEYGMRVGFWRLKAALDRFGVTPTLSINAAVCLDYPRVAAAARDTSQLEKRPGCQGVIPGGLVEGCERFVVALLPG
jgi:allantoinase